MKPDVQIASTESEWVKLASSTIISQSIETIQKRRLFSLVLSGGSTPEPVYQSLSSPKNRGLLDWNRIYIFFGDERCVPPTDKASNYKMARETLLDSIPIPEENIFRMRGEIEPEEAAMAYESEINHFFAGKEKRFDTILLGLGDDGHTASLFPNTPGLTESHRWVIPNENPYSNSMRLTLTYPAINSARQIVFLVKGEKKSKIVADIIQNQDGSPGYPAQRVRGKEDSPK
ncbi:MAG: 6-phosphogluconolactonase, partial [Aliifodinibius sp.]|nr:6-phosphogluconolactonase [Fodinibius sp.]